MELENNNNSHLSEPPETVMLKRTRQITWLVLLAFIGNFIIVTVRGEYSQAILIFFLTLCTTFSVILAAKKRYEQAAQILISVLTIGTLALLWTSGGLYDMVLLAIPGISIFAAMLGMSKVNISVLIVFAINIILIGLFEEYELISFEASAHGLIRAIAICFVLAPILLATYLLTKDYRKVLTNLKDSLESVKKHADNADFLASHDPLTQLPNRAFVKKRFEHAKKMASRNNSKIGLLYLDIDKFKSINDSLGHKVGDSFILFIANTCRNSLRQSDTIARLGGDEFLVIVEQIQNIDELVTVANKLLNATKSTYFHDPSKNAISSSISIGISLFPDDSESYEELMDKADLAMYHSKEKGRNTFSFFDESMNKDALQRAHMLEDMKTGLKLNHFYMVYQPIINLKTGLSDGAEALIRWKHPTKGLFSPAEFIPLAEKTGFIVDLGEWILEQSIIDCLRFKQEIGRPYIISVNISAIQLRRGDFTTTLKKIIEKHQIPGDYLCIELTESELFSENKEFVEFLQYAQQKAIKVSIDDFGTGYSNLGYLHRLNLTRLKLDYSFITKIDKSEQKQSVAASIKHLATGLKMETVAEGVETQQELDHIMEIGLDRAQGYLWSKPLRFDDAVRYLNNHKI